MNKFWGYEPDKFFYSRYTFITGIVLISLNILHFVYRCRHFSENYLSWVNASNSRHVFDYLLGKTAILNGFFLSLVILQCAYLVFFADYKRGAMVRIYHSGAAEVPVFRQKVHFSFLVIAVFQLVYVFLIMGFSFYLIAKHPDLIGGQAKYALDSFAEYSSIYLVFAIRSALLLSIFFKIFKAHLTATTFFIILSVTTPIFPRLPFATVYTTDMNFLLVAYPAIIYAIIFYILDRKLQYANRII